MLSEITHLRNCKKISLVTDLNTGEVVCSHCGAVVPEKLIDLNAESSHATAEEYLTNGRTGQRTSLKMADMGLSTIMESKDRDSTGKSLSSENKRMFYRLRMWDRNSRFSRTNQSYLKAFTLLDGLKAKLGLSEAVVEQTAYLFRKITLKKILAGRSTAGMICATTYIACRITNTPRTVQDVADAGNIKRKQLQSIYRFLLQELEIYPDSYNPAEFVTRISNECNVSEKTKRQALDVLFKSEKLGITTSKNPMAMAAAALYISALQNQEKISQIKISKVSGISSVTIRDRAKEIKNSLEGEL
ncbi:transcription factor TFIIB [archaeon]|nr:transcription factor TFIIB [archaeon]